MTQTDGDGDQVGSVAEEAAKLLGALSGWAKENGDGIYGGLHDGVSAFADDLHDHVAPGSPDCTWCPVCRTVAAVRQASPEVRAHLGSAASSLMLAVSGLLASRPPARDPRRDGGTRMERIRLDDVPDEQPDGQPDDWSADAWLEDVES